MEVSGLRVVFGRLRVVFSVFSPFRIYVWASSDFFAEVAHEAFDCRSLVYVFAIEQFVVFRQDRLDEMAAICELTQNQAAPEIIFAL